MKIISLTRLGILASFTVMSIGAGSVRGEDSSGEEQPARSFAGDARTLLRREMEMERSGHSANIYELRRRSEEVVPFLGEYVADNSINVRMAVVLILGGSKSREALELLVPFTGDSNSGIAHRAVKTIYNNFDRGQVRLWAKKPLADNLKSNLREEPNFAQALALVAALGADSIPYLTSLRKSAPNDLKVVMLPETSKPVEFTFAVDVFLAECGDAEALKRVLAKTQPGQDPQRMFLTDCFKFIDNPVLLKLVATWLNDKSPARKVGRDNSGYISRYCDLAWGAWAPRIGKTNFILNTPVPKSDEELEDTSRKVGQLLAQ